MSALSPRGTMVLTSTSFLALGLLAAGLGPALPDLAVRTGRPLAAMGSVVSAQFLGSLLAQVVAGPLTDRVGPRLMLGLGFSLITVGEVGMLLSSSLTLGLICLVVAGLGFGTAVLSANLMIARVFPERSVAALNLLNFFYGVGAIAGPAAAGLTLRTSGSALPPLWIAVVLMGLLVPLTPLLPASARTETHRPAGGARSAGLFGSPLLWCFGSLFLVYVGLENGVGSWSRTYIEQTTAVAPSVAALITSGYWLAYTCARGLAAAAGTRLTPGRILTISCSLAVAGSSLLLVSRGHLALTTAAVLLVGFAYGPIFPTALAMATAAFPKAAGITASLCVGMGSGGGMLLPWLVGWLLERSGPSAGMGLLVALSVAMIGLYALSVRVGRRHAGLFGERVA